MTPEAREKRKKAFIKGFVSSLKGDFGSIESFLKSDESFDIDTKDENGKTLLMYAAEFGNHKVIEMLLERGANPSVRNKTGKTALMLAAEKGHNKAIRVLLEAGVPVNEKDNFGWTALMWAAIKPSMQNYNAIKKIMRSGGGFDILGKAIKFFSGVAALAAGPVLTVFFPPLGIPLFIVGVISTVLTGISLARSLSKKATLYYKLSSIENMMDLTEDSDIPSDFEFDEEALDEEFEAAVPEESYFSYLTGSYIDSAKSGFAKVKGFFGRIFKGKSGAGDEDADAIELQDLEDKISKKEVFFKGFISSLGGDVEDSIDFLKKEGEVNYGAVDEEGKNILMHAAETGKHKVVEMLLKKGIDPNIKNKNGKTALMYASENGHLETIERLLKGGAKVNAQDKFGWTSLMWAALSPKKNFHAIKKLIKSGGGFNLAVKSIGFFTGVVAIIAGPAVSAVFPPLGIILWAVGIVSTVITGVTLAIGLYKKASLYYRLLKAEHLIDKAKLSEEPAPIQVIETSKSDLETGLSSDLKKGVSQNEIRKRLSLIDDEREREFGDTLEKERRDELKASVLQEEDSLSKGTVVEEVHEEEKKEKDIGMNRRV